MGKCGTQIEDRRVQIPEDTEPGEQDKAIDERLALEKGRAIAKQRPQDIVLGADTVVVVDNQILGKPRDGVDAVRMLRMLSGRDHQVITAVCLVQGGEPLMANETTQVTMSEISEQQIAEYAATGEPMDKAGAYAIQGIASRWIPRIEGDYSNVVGLPVALVWRMLCEVRAK